MLFSINFQVRMQIGSFLLHLSTYKKHFNVLCATSATSIVTTWTGTWLTIVAKNPSSSASSVGFGQNGRLLWRNTNEHTIFSRVLVLHGLTFELVALFCWLVVIRFICYWTNTSPAFVFQFLCNKLFWQCVCNYLYSFACVSHPIAHSKNYFQELPWTFFFS